MSSSLHSAFRRARVKQIRFSSLWLNRLSKLPLASSLIRAVRGTTAFRAVAGYQRPFATLREAETAVAQYSLGGHANPDNAKIHLDLAAQPRPSDYPALFHLRSILPEIRSVFDFGGNVGNLYYCYSKVIEFSADLIWTSFDVPEMRALGEQLAEENGERKLRFSDSLQAADGADLFIASGSLHYFDEPLFSQIAKLPRKPKYLLVNRTPLTDHETVATIQDAGSFLVACKLYNKKELLKGFEAIGYQQLDSWRVDELSVRIPCYSDLSVPAYSGIFLKLRENATVATPQSELAESRFGHRTGSTEIGLANHLHVQAPVLP